MTRLLYLLLLPLLALGCEDPEAPPPSEATPPAIPFRQDDVENAETDSARARGLMQRRGLPEASGMLFRFDREEMQSFWMANTPIALDILFIDADSQIVSMAKYTRPFSPQSVASEAPARYVLELEAGAADSYGLIETDRVRWRRTGE